MKSKQVLLFSFFFLAVTLNPVFSQEKKDSVEKFQFKEVVRWPATSVKNQAETGTCWCFATTSFLESELLRMNKGEFNLSEMFTVHNTYNDKASRFVRFHGTLNFGQGGQAHDVMNSIRKYGIVPDTNYNGLCNGQTHYNHSELEKVLISMTKAYADPPGGKLSPEWYRTINAVTEVYLGKAPDTFIYNDKTYTPTSFASANNINPDDYIEITSYSHHPFYSKFPLEIPDNWSGDQYYNLPIDELVQVMEYALKNGYTVAWDGDVSDRGFSQRSAVAIVPDIKLENPDLSNREKWEKIPEKDRALQFYMFTKPVPEKKVTQEMRQIAFDNFSTTDDHLMHVTGIDTDQNGTRYYRTKNSWGTDSNKNGGYLNISEAYVRLNTIAIMVHRNAIPKDIQKKLSLK
jgi:bleomycin hydrolase